jgi:hypothetical protein
MITKLQLITKEIMKNFVLVFRGGKAPQSEEEGKKVMALWTDWFASLGDAVVDMGAPLGESKTIAPDGQVGTGTAELTGYTILKADSLDKAVEVSKTCPQLASEGSLEVYEVNPIM